MFSNSEIMGPHKLASCFFNFSLLANFNLCEYDFKRSLVLILERIICSLVDNLEFSTLQLVHSSGR